MTGEDQKYNTQTCQTLYEKLIALEDQGYPTMGSQGTSTNDTDYFKQALEFPGMHTLTRASLAQSVIMNAAKDGHNVVHLLQNFDEFCESENLDGILKNQKNN